MARNPLTPFRRGSLFGGGSDPFMALHREMNRLFDDVFRGKNLTTLGEAEGAGAVSNSSMPI
jgi:HSP20 family protein